MTHPNEELIRELFATYGRRDLDAASRMFHEDAVFSYPGPGPLHGDYRGRAAIIGFWTEQERLAGTFQPDLVDLVAGEHNVFLLVRVPPAGVRVGWTRVVVYEIAGGKIAAARVFEDDPSAAAAYFAEDTP